MTKGFLNKGSLSLFMLSERRALIGGKRNMNMNLNDQMLIKSVLRDMIDEGMKKKDRCITISFYDDSVSVSVLPLVEEEEVADTGWISVKDKLPDNYVSVILCGGAGSNVIDFGHYCDLDGHWYLSRQIGLLYFTPKYWMSIP